MKKMNTSFLKYFRHLCAALSAVLLALHFTPFWTLEEESLSLYDYTWFTYENESFTKFIKSTFGDLAEVFGNKFAANNIGGAVIIVFVAAVIGLVLYLVQNKKGGSFVGDIVFFFCGLGGAMFLSNPILQMGSTYILHGILGIILIVAALCSFVYHVISLRSAAEKVH